MLEQLKHRMGADTVRIQLKWNEVAPQPSARTKPNFEASDPGQYQGSPTPSRASASTTTSCGVLAHSACAS